MAFPAFFDTSALFGAALSDLLLTLAENGLYRPLWSADVLDELQRSLVRRGISAEAVAHRIAAMRSAFPDAEVDGYRDLVSSMTNDDGDRHILAAAVRANAGVLVTFNLRHFPVDALEPYDIEAVHPDDFLLDQFELYGGAMLSGLLIGVVSSYERPPLTVAEYLERLRAAGVPRFADRVERAL